MASRVRRNRRSKRTRQNKKIRRTRQNRKCNKLQKNKTKKGGVHGPSPYTRSEPRPQRSRGPADPLQKAVQSVQWLIDLGGIDSVRQAIINKFTPSGSTDMIRRAVLTGVCLPNHLIFTPGGDGSGHHTFQDQTGMIWDSYKQKHQPKGTHALCQTFALIYLISQPDNWKLWCQQFKLDPCPDTYLSKLQEQKFAKNIQVGVSFWKELFKDQEIGSLLVEELKALNEIYKLDATKGYSVGQAPLQPILEDINIATVNKKLDLLMIPENADAVSRIPSNLVATTLMSSEELK